jgi:glycosyltransferase involved in cell wall biosynthesis
MNPFFSVIIPTYNRARSIGDAVKSVLAQTFTDFELIIIDDGSKDNTAEVLKPFCDNDHRVRYIYQANAERSAARNHGIEVARGQYICFLDSDDVYLDSHLAEFHRTVTRHHCPVAFFIGNSLSEVNGKLLKDPPYVTETDDPVELMLKISFCSQQVCIHRDILKEHRYDVKLRVGEDQELWSRIVRHYPVIRSEQYTIVIRDLGDRTVNAMNVDSYKANLRLRKLIISRDTDGRIKPEWAKFALSAAYYKLAVSYLKRKALLPFYWNMLRSIAIDPSHFFKDKLLVMASSIPFIRKRIEHRLPLFVRN